MHPLITRPCAQASLLNQERPGVVNSQRGEFLARRIPGAAWRIPVANCRVANSAWRIPVANSHGEFPRGEFRMANSPGEFPAWRIPAVFGMGGIAHPAKTFFCKEDGVWAAVALASKSVASAIGNLFRLTECRRQSKIPIASSRLVP